MLINTKLTNRIGFDRLDIMVHFLPVLESENIEKDMNELKSFISDQIKRELETEEEINLYDGLINYVSSEPATDERSEAMNYLFDFHFLNAY